jgi:hypothetical protein
MRQFIRLALGASILAACSSSNNTGNDAGSGNNPDSGGPTADGGATDDGGGNTDGGGTGDSGSTGDGGTTSDGGGPSEGGTNGAFRAIALLGNSERVTGAYCTDAHTCVVTADPFGQAGHVYSSDGTTITGTLVTGDDTYAAKFGTIGTVSFLGVSLVGGKVVARVIDAEDAFVSATGPITVAASWTGVAGASNTTDFGLNRQHGFGTNGTRWTLMSGGRVWEAMAAPGPTTAWTNIYSPQAVPPIPADIATQHAADPTLCDTDPSVEVAPDLTQTVYIAPDGSLIVTPSGAVNQGGDDTAGVCISLDGGHSFHHAEFTGVVLGAGPVGVACTSKDHCVAYGGVPAVSASAYVYVSNSASKGATSTWTKATTPTLADDTELRSVAFAPDGMTGWLVGNTAAKGSLLFTTKDGGATWTDATATITAVTGDNPLHSVYAFDATHVWIGGLNDTLITSGN